MLRDYHIVMIGAGNLATQLAKAFYNKGFCVDQVYSRTLEAAKGLATQVRASHTTQWDQIDSGKDLYIVALSDEALMENLPDIIGLRTDSLVVHTAGSVPMEIFESHAKRYGVFYPMQTFSKARDVEFDNIPLFIEANSEADKRTF